MSLDASQITAMGTALGVVLTAIGTLVNVLLTRRTAHNTKQVAIASEEANVIASQAVVVATQVATVTEKTAAVANVILEHVNSGLGKTLFTSMVSAHLLSNKEPENEKYRQLAEKARDDYDEHQRIDDNIAAKTAAATEKTAVASEAILDIVKPPTKPE